MCTKPLMQRFHKLWETRIFPLARSLTLFPLLRGILQGPPAPLIVRKIPSQEGCHALFRPSTPHIPYPAATVLRRWMPLDTGSAYTAAKCPTKTTSRLIVPSSRLQVYSFDGFRTRRSSYYPGIRCIQVLLLPYPYMVILTGRVCNLLV